MTVEQERVLKISFHGRLIQHLGIQMYQKPAAALAEMISNSWDADAYNVEVKLPDELNDSATIEISDNGMGMTFEECQEKFLKVGRSRRGSNPEEKTPKENRPVLGRKGIGKFAGFGIAKVVEVTTVSEETGEKTVFEMDIDTLMSDSYAEEGGPVRVLEALGPNPSLIDQHGSKIVLKDLTIKRNIDIDKFMVSMSRRFLLAQRSENFAVTINDVPLEDIEYEPAEVQFSFPVIYSSEDAVTILDQTYLVDGWGVSTLASGQIVKWKVDFYKLPIAHEEFRGIAIYANGKLAQSSFMFNLAGGLSGQHGQEYMSGRMEADYIDTLEDDVISTERQRINWETDATGELEAWGQDLIKKLLKDWQRLRQKEKEDYIADKIDEFGERLGKLEKHERRTVEGALKKIAGVSSLTLKQFEDLGSAVLTSWEKGRNKELIDNMATANELDSDQLLDILLESSVLSALSMAEGARTRLETVVKLKEMIDGREKENTVRDYIANDAWIIKPNFETYKKETRATSVIESAKAVSGDIITPEQQGDDYNGRVDLVISNEDTLVLVEFMRPGLTMDWDHINRFERYMLILREKIGVETTLGFKKVEGYIVADNIESRSEVRSKVQSMTKEGMYASSWGTLVQVSVDEWKFYLESLVSRRDDDQRLIDLLP